MFPGTPRQSTPPHQPFRPNRQMPGPPKQSMLSHFRDSEGNLDMEKISLTARQVSELYSQVSPMIIKAHQKIKNR